MHRIKNQSHNKIQVLWSYFSEAVLLRRNNNNNNIGSINFLMCGWDISQIFVIFQWNICRNNTHVYLSIQKKSLTNNCVKYVCDNKDPFCEKKSYRSIIQLPFSLSEEILLIDWCVENNASCEKSQELWAEELSSSEGFGIPVSFFRIHISFSSEKMSYFLLSLNVISHLH